MRGRAAPRLALALAPVVALMLATTGCSSNATLVGPTWQWIGLTLNNPKHQSAVPDPQNYTLTLKDDGTFQAKADCNQLAGTYTMNGSALTLTHGPMTLVACPSGSQSDQFVTLLGTVSSYSIDAKDLSLNLAKNAGVMGFNEP
jgi:heat shock protein HslJ